MILLYYPKLTRPKNRRFPLSVMALAAVLEEEKSTRSSTEISIRTLMPPSGA